MTNPADPGGPYRPAEPGYRPAEPGRPGGPGPSGGQEPSPYGPPPPRRAPGPGTGPQQQPGRQATGQQQAPVWGPPPGADRTAPPATPETKGLLGALFDLNFNHLVTPRLIKLWYVLALLLVTLSTLMVVAAGIWISQVRNGWLLGLLVIVSSPLVWLFGAVLTRILMESVVVRFKGVEHLRVIKDKI